MSKLLNITQVHFISQTLLNFIFNKGSSEQRARIMWLITYYNTACAVGNSEKFLIPFPVSDGRIGSPS